MKRGILCFVLTALFALPTLAAAEVHGVYVAPKFLVGIQDSGQLHRKNTRFDDDSQAVKQYSQAVFGGALAAGYNFAPKFNVPIRTEVEFALRSNSSNKQDAPGPAGRRDELRQTTNLSTLFFNAYFDIHTGTPLTPYIGGGLGMAFNYTELKYEDNTGMSDSRSRHDTTFAWNAGAGVSYAFTENVAADLGYRFIGTGYREIKLGDAKVGSSPYINEFYLGARFTF
jgi:opacity protein-like surface antigen